MRTHWTLYSFFLLWTRKDPFSALPYPYVVSYPSFFFGLKSSSYYPGLQANPIMKQASILSALALILTATTNTVNATGYKPDPTHRYEHNADIDKLLHPNHEIHVVQQRRSVPKKEHNLNANKGAGSEDEEDGEMHTRARARTTVRTGRRGDDKVLLMGGRYVVNHEIQNVVTNILEASAAVERESVLKFDTSSEKKKK